MMRDTWRRKKTDIPMTVGEAARYKSKGKSREDKALVYKMLVALCVVFLVFFIALRTPTTGEEVNELYQKKQAYLHSKGDTTEGRRLMPVWRMGMLQTLWPVQTWQA